MHLAIIGNNFNLTLKPLITYVAKIPIRKVEFCAFECFEVYHIRMYLYWKTRYEYHYHGERQRGRHFDVKNSDVKEG